MAGRITLAEFLRLPVSERRERFDDLAASDQLAFVMDADSVELILGGYPSEERIIAWHDAAAPDGAPIH